eukprot:1158086-Pelagomonas_calceolata.AAC.21
MGSELICELLNGLMLCFIVTMQWNKSKTDTINAAGQECMVKSSCKYMMLDPIFFHERPWQLHFRVCSEVDCHHTLAKSPTKYVHKHDAGDHEGAEVAHKRAMRTERYNPQLWEGLGASYQGLGKTTAALKVSRGHARASSAGCVLLLL